MNKYMEIAINEAKKSKTNVPVGAVIVCNEEIVSKAHNGFSVTSHAEMIAIEEALKKTDSRYLDNCEIYITLEPCLMCLGAIINSRISKIYFGAYDKNKKRYDVYMIAKDRNIEVYGGIMELESTKLLKNYFISQRSSL